ncbi:unnamed protein product [Sphagnum jensenii]|uniref:Peptidase C14 caspase domain-containing protein n=1 Tax=Sphagnum jensenii TaxID=128206 RepID=A0ABP0WBR2_9BRYO
MPRAIKKRALLVGCNYPGTRGELTGCWNDVQSMRETLINRYGFNPQDICVLVDQPQQSLQPTGGVVWRHLEKLVRDVQARDVLVFLFSGHGIQLPPEGVPDETGAQECIMLADKNVITDIDFRVLVENLPDGILFTVIADSCHSGGLIQHLEQQIGSGPQFERPPDQSNLETSTGSGSRFHTWLNKEHQQVGPGPFGYSGVHCQDYSGSHFAYAEGSSGNDHVGTYSQPQLSVLEKHRMYRRTSPQAGSRLVKKCLTVDMFIGMLSQRAHHQVEVGNIRANLYDIFKDDASIMVKSFARNIISKLQEDNMLNTTGNLAAQFLKQRLKDEGMAYARPAFAAVLQPLDTAAFNNKCVLISACQSDEESFDFKEGSSYGTLSNAIQTILRQHRDPIDNFHLVLAVKTLLKNQGFPQHPGLYCGAKKADSVFICY